MRLLAREMRRHVTVALTGDGGDEVFLGYGRYGRFREQMIAWQQGVRPALPYQPLLGEEGSPRIRDRYVRAISVFREEHKQAGYGPNLARFLFVPSIDRLGLGIERAVPDNAIDLAARTECDMYLPDDLCVKADIACMAVSLEGRSPLLDHHLADWAASIPQEKRVLERNGRLEMKGLLKYACEPFLPAATLYRRKQGFAVPVAHWMKNEIKDYTIDLLTSQRFRQRGLMSPGFVNRMLEHHFSGREDHGTRLWVLLCLEMWFQTFIDRSENGPLTVDIRSAGAGLRLAG